MAAVVVVVAGGAAGAAVALSGGSGTRLTAASFPGYELSFRYPASWKRVDWCWTETNVSPITVVTTARKPPVCQESTVFGGGTPLPPPELLQPDGVSVSWQYFDRPGQKVPPPNGTVGGRPASVRLGWQRVRGRIAHGPICGKDGTRERTLVAEVPHVLTSTGVMRVDAMMCGPDFAAGEATVRRVLATARFTG